jgi:branched-subunit amino acid aminotransferase/4-amino-4-deoxychorismate lyase
VVSLTAGPLIHIDGEEPTVGDLAHAAMVNYGHFTAMQVRAGAVRGLDKHLVRLQTAHAELFGTELDLQRVRHFMRLAAAEQPDSYLRVTVFEAEPGTPLVMTILRPPIEANLTPQTLLPVTYSRPFAHIKHVGSFAQILHSVDAERQGFDDALLVAEDGRICETTIANIGFIDGTNLVWPNGPALHGITWQILDERLTADPIATSRAPLTLGTVGAFDGAFITNSVGIAPVGKLGPHDYRDGSGVLTRVIAAYETAPWDGI